MKHNAICPYCSHEEIDSWEIECGEGEPIEYECTNCGETYLLTRNIKITYYTEKLGSDEE